jgi:hypothetical protein
VNSCHHHQSERYPELQPSLQSSIPHWHHAPKSDVIPKATMNPQSINPYSSPNASLEAPGHARSRPGLYALGLLVGFVTGFAAILAMMYATYLHYLAGVSLAIIFVTTLVIIWRRRTHNPARSLSFQLGFLTTATIFQALMIILLLLRQVPNDRRPAPHDASTRSPSA